MTMPTESEIREFLMLLSLLPTSDRTALMETMRTLADAATPQD